VNSSGGIIIPKLLELMGGGCELYCEPNGHFPHNRAFKGTPDISELVVKEGALRNQ
jgi:phosphomannomutase